MKIREKIAQVVLAIGFILFVVMSLYCCRYINFMADDYSFMWANKIIQEENPVIFTLNYGRHFLRIYIGKVRGFQMLLFIFYLVCKFMV